MFRNSLADNDQEVLEAITPGEGSYFQYRTTSGGSSTGTTGKTNTVTALYWVKLVHSGTTVTGYHSPDGIN